MALLVHDFLDEAAARLPEKVAVRSDDGSVSYRELAERSRRVAAWLHGRGVRRGDRMLLLLPNGIPAVVALFAASRIGALFVIVNPAVKPFHLRHILADAEPALIVAGERPEGDVDLDAHAPVLRLGEQWEEAQAFRGEAPAFPGISSDPVCLIYTSGSTGKPKAVVSAHRNVVAATRGIQACLKMRESDVVGTFLPLSFDVGLYQLFLSFQVGATVALGHEGHVGPLLLKKIQEWQVTGLPGVPNLAHMLIRMSRRAGGKLPPLRYVTNTGAHLPRAYIEEIRELYPQCQVFVMFGLTECKRVSILDPAEYERKRDSVGRPLPDTECVIIDADGNPVPPGVPGELVVRGPHVMLGYWRAPELTAKRYRPFGPGMEIALYTGDTCSLDEEGYLYFHGRSDDIYKQRGYRVSALEVEAAACDVPGVQQAALIPPSERHGATLFAVTDLTSQQVLAALQERLEEYKLPAQIITLETLPLMPNGKTDRTRLRATLDEAATA
ncbi:MAG TPA: AMP-binding protein [Longimicrobium sp.]|nr:AMP-binding protein [Longimicrobium sp.]